MELTTIWFILIAVLWSGYLILEGFDFGVGMLVPVLGRVRGNPAEANTRRRVLLNTIGPFWDGNEVWLVTAAGAMFAAFPAWYATMFSGFYLPLLLLLVALIMRNLGIDYRHKRDNDVWRSRWDASIVFGSLLSPFIVGAALTATVHGVPLDADHVFRGSVLSVLSPLAILGGLTMVALSVMHGALFLTLKTEDELRQQARHVGYAVGPVALGLQIILLAWVHTAYGTVASLVVATIGVLALIAAMMLNLAEMEGAAFVGTFLAIGATFGSYFVALFPVLLPSTTNPDWSLTTTNAASTPLTLQIMTVAAVIFLPVVLLYTAWNYWVFRRRISASQIPPAHDPLAASHAPGTPASHS